MGGDQRVIWTVPTSPFTYQGQDPNRGAFDGSAPVGAGFGAAAGAAGYGAAPTYDSKKNESKPKKDDSKKNMMMGAAGGLAVGAIGGALIANALGTLKVLYLAKLHECFSTSVHHILTVHYQMMMIIILVIRVVTRQEDTQPREPTHHQPDPALSAVVI